MLIVEMRDLLRILSQHSQSAFSLLSDMPQLDKAVFVQAADNLAVIARLHAITDYCARRSRPIDKRVQQAIIRAAKLSKIVHYALDRMVRRQLSMKIMEAYRRRGELLLDVPFFDAPCVMLHQQWDSYLRAERWLVATGAENFPTDPEDGLRLIEQWAINGCPGPQ